MCLKFYIIGELMKAPYRIKGEGEKSAVADTLEFISPVIAELADMHGKVERGEVDLFKTAEGK